MSPVEVAAFYFVVPLMAIMAWFFRRFETDGAEVPEFEAWCAREKPVLFAARCTSGSAASVGDAIARAVGGRREVENHQGVFPWTRYVFKLEVDVDPKRDVVRVRVAQAVIRRLVEPHPEIGRIIDALTGEVGDSLEALWLHAEVRKGDEERDRLRRERGWQASVERGTVKTFIPTFGLPAWARLPARDTTPILAASRERT
jgi:hypothetical protein